MRHDHGYRGPAKCRAQAGVLVALTGLVDQNVDADSLRPGCCDVVDDIGEQAAVDRRAIGKLRQRVLVDGDD